MAISEVSVFAAILGGFIVFFGLVSLFLKEKVYLSEAFVALLFGIIVGPVALNIINPNDWGNIDSVTLEFTRVVIAIQVMATGVSLPKAYLRKEWLSLFMLLVPVMIWMWTISGLAIWLLIPNLSFLESLMIASCVTPTDPILANSIVKGRFAEKHVPLHVRNILSAESGANDGLGFPFLFLAIYLIEYDNVGHALGKWAYWIVAFQVLLSIVIGFVVGFVARKVLKFAQQKGIIDKESFLVFAIALSLFIMGCVSIIGSDDLLACFIAGNSFTWDDWFRKETEAAHLQEVIDLLLNLSIFVYFGTIIPWADFVESEFLQLSVWRLVVLAIVVLLFRRMPAVVAMTRAIPAIVTYREALFSGWFGPIGVGAIFYAMVAQEQFKAFPGSRAGALIVPVVYFLVIASVFVHGITVPMVKFGLQIQRTFTRNSQTNQVLGLPKLEIGQSVDLTLMGRNTLNPSSRPRSLDGSTPPGSHFHSVLMFPSSEFTPSGTPPELLTPCTSPISTRPGSLLRVDRHDPENNIEAVEQKPSDMGMNVYREGRQIVVENANDGDVGTIRVYDLPHAPQTEPLSAHHRQESHISFVEPVILRMSDR